MKNKEHTRQVRDTVVKKFKAGFGYKKISQALNIPRSTVQAIILCLNVEHFINFERFFKCSRKKTSSSMMKLVLMSAATEDKFISYQPQKLQPQKNASEFK
jgi:hypothetical protein